MFKNSTELLDHALRELQVAIESDKKTVDIVLEKMFATDAESVKKYCEEFEIKDLTEILRTTFSEYDIKSVVASEGYLQAIITFKKAPCNMYYPLVWKLSVQKKSI